MVLQVTSFGSSNLLERRAVVQGSEGLMNQAPTLTSTQLEMNQISDGFTKGASDWRALASMSLGGFAFKLGKLATMGAVSSTMAATGMGLLAEVVTFRTSESLLHGQSLKGAFEGKGFASTALSFGLLKGSGSIFRNQNQVLAHTLQSATMVVGHELGARLKLVEAQSGNFTQRLINAEVMNIQMQAGASLVHVMLPGLSMREKALDLAAQSFLLTKERLRQNSGLGETLPLMALEQSSATSPTPPHESLVYLPRTRFVMGSELEGIAFKNEGPARVVEVDGYWMRRAQTTWAEYREYVEAQAHEPYAIMGRNKQTGRMEILRRGDSSKLRTLFTSLQARENRSDASHDGHELQSVVKDKFSIPKGKEKHPVVKVTCYGALGFADWWGRTHTSSGRPGYLPTEAQWENAARGEMVDLAAEAAKERMDIQKMSPEEFRTWVMGNEIQGQHEQGRFGRYENFVLWPEPGEMLELGATIFRDPEIHALIAAGHKIGGYRVFPTEKGDHDDSMIYSSVMITRKSTRPVDEGTPNPNGLIIGGNAWDWMNDKYGPYQDLPVVNPSGAVKGNDRVLRAAGSWGSSIPRYLRIAGRIYDDPDLHDPVVSFRVVFHQD